MHGDRAVALLIVIAFIGAVYTPCRPLIPASVHGVYEAAGENGQGGFFPVSNGDVNDKSARSNPPALKARCPCGCDERPAVAGSSPGLGVALIARAPSLYPLPSHRELASRSSILPLEPPRKIDAIPRSI
ncbi:MAG TPA: hypothetical protein VKM54_25465 [Myxococcota bacterium]|nr:hypothetical protein [Myxococcota bacterium]